MKEAPRNITISYAPHGASGMLCAYSEDLEGFRVYGRSVEELEREIPLVASALVREAFGVDCKYEWNDEEGFALAKQLVPAHACH